MSLAEKSLLANLGYVRALHEVDEWAAKAAADGSWSGTTLNDIHLPRTIVIGDESSGKSTTLERLIGFSILPRASGICTRQPVVLKLRYDPCFPEERPQIRLRIPTISSPHPPSMSPKLAQELLMKHMQSVASSCETGILHDEEIEVEIRSAGVPTMDLVDLPGLVTTVDDNADIAKATEDCTRAFLAKEDTGMVLCVLAANIDNLRCSKALRLMQEALQQGHIADSNTIGVFAKADKTRDCDHEDEGFDSAFWRLEQRLLRLNDDDRVDGLFQRHGFIALKNQSTRNQKHADLTHAEYNLAEQSWFAKEMGAFIRSHPDKCGRAALIRRIDTTMCEHLAVSWVPQKKEEARQARETLAERLENLGTNPAVWGFDGSGDDSEGGSDICLRTYEGKTYPFHGGMAFMQQVKQVFVGSEVFSVGEINKIATECADKLCSSKVTVWSSLVDRLDQLRTQSTQQSPQQSPHEGGCSAATEEDQERLLVQLKEGLLLCGVEPSSYRESSELRTLLKEVAPAVDWDCSDTDVFFGSVSESAKASSGDEGRGEERGDLAVDTSLLTDDGNDGVKYPFSQSMTLSFSVSADDSAYVRVQKRAMIARAFGIDPHDNFGRHSDKIGPMIDHAHAKIKSKVHQCFDEDVDGPVQLHRFHNYREALKEQVTSYLTAEKRHEFLEDMHELMRTHVLQSRGGSFDPARLHRAVEECVMERLLLEPLMMLQFISDYTKDSHFRPDVDLRESCADVRCALHEQLRANDELQRTYDRIATASSSLAPSGELGLDGGYNPGAASSA